LEGSESTSVGILAKAGKVPDFSARRVGHSQAGVKLDWPSPAWPTRQFRTTPGPRRFSGERGALLQVTEQRGAKDFRQRLSLGLAQLPRRLLVFIFRSVSRVRSWPGRLSSSG